MLNGYIHTYLTIDYWDWKKILHFYFYTQMLPSMSTFDCPKISGQKYLSWLSGPKTKNLSFPLSILYSLIRLRNLFFVLISGFCVWKFHWAINCRYGAPIIVMPFCAHCHDANLCQVTMIQNWKSHLENYQK